MKRVILGLLIILILSTLSGPGFSQDETIIINSPELGEHKRPLVEFPHLIHEDLYDCMECHHDYDESGVNIGGDGGYCADCHTVKAGDNPVPLLDAVHSQCLGCHAEAIVTSANKNMPQMCGQCHARKDRGVGSR